MVACDHPVVPAGSLGTGLPASWPLRPHLLARHSTGGPGVLGTERAATSLPRPGTFGSSAGPVQWGAWLPHLLGPYCTRYLVRGQTLRPRVQPTPTPRAPPIGRKSGVTGDPRSVFMLNPVGAGGSWSHRPPSVGWEGTGAGLGPGQRGELGRGNEGDRRQPGGSARCAVTAKTNLGRDAVRPPS